MTDEQQELLLKAQQSLDAAKLLLSQDFADYAMSYKSPRCSILFRRS